MTKPGSNSAAVPIRGGAFLVTGGASLVGAATVELLLAGGAVLVRVFDNFSLGAEDAVAQLCQDPRVELIRGDVLRLPQLLRATEGITGVIHLASLMSLSMDSDPWTGLRVNVEGVQNTLEACRANRVRKVVFASSIAAYGFGPGIAGDLVETTPFHAVGAPPGAILYGASKIIGEQLCRHAYRKSALDYVALRYSTVYGERQHRRAANALYIVEAHERIQRGQRPQVIGDGQETKHFVYVGDVARANCRALEANATDIALNLSGPQPISTLELVRLVAELSGHPEIEPEMVPPDPAKLRLTSGGAFRVDHAAADSALGWRPEVDMREGLRRLLEWRNRAAA